MLIRDMYVLVVGALTRFMEIGEEALRRRSLLADAYVERSQEIKKKTVHMLVIMVCFR